ncbi:MntC [Schleiferilactobacillus shenzhenensis LY-73]|uniref:Manganese import system permease protein ScaB n=2 Tax=Schleiferilactobacillus shenzhenensis TaxID=1231337 RepID=U4TU78_9LACO|nr:MntC [Schleiferilactobacillus shenzhenensis LY-73]
MMASIQAFFTGLGQYQFLQMALISAVLVGIMAGVLGSFIILKGMSLMGDALSHAVLPGVATSYMLGIPMILGAGIFGLLAALLIGYASRKSPLKNDTVIGIVFSAFFALGYILIAGLESTTNLHHILFGNVLAVSRTDVWTTLVVFNLVILAVVFFFKELQISTFDPNFARSYGLPTGVIHYGLMTALTVVTVVALQSVGIILIVAMLVTPAATAYLWTHRLQPMLWLAGALGGLSAFIGLFLSYTWNWASGPAIVLTAAVFFVISFLAAPKRRAWRGEGAVADA